MALALLTQQLWFGGQLSVLPASIEAQQAQREGRQMDSTVREHICRLKARIDLLSEQIANNHCTPQEVKNSKAELGIAFLALAHYEAALKQERKLAFVAQEASRRH